MSCKVALLSVCLPWPTDDASQQGAAAFVETLDFNSLKVDQDELIAHMLAAGAMTEADLAMLQVGVAAVPASLQYIVQFMPH